VLRILLLSITLVTSAMAQSPSTSTDLFVMPGFDAPDIKLNLNLGVGHTFTRLHSSLIGDELTAAYTYEGPRSHSSTESIGVMKNIALGHSPYAIYLWQQVGLTQSSGNHLYLGSSLGLSYHLSAHSSLWLQESLNNVWSHPYYTSTGIGYTYSF
jgi:hypothetical protein